MIAIDNKPLCTQFSLEPTHEIWIQYFERFSIWDIKLLISHGEESVSERGWTSLISLTAIRRIYSTENFKLRVQISLCFLITLWLP